MASDDVRAKAEHGMAILDALADKWAAEVDLTSMIKDASYPMNLNRNAPADVRDRFRLKMEAQIYAIARYAFIEGMYRAITGLKDERDQMRALGINPDARSA